MHYADDELNTLAEAIVRSMDGEEPDLKLIESRQWDADLIYSLESILEERVQDLQCVRKWMWQRCHAQGDCNLYTIEEARRRQKSRRMDRVRDLNDRAIDLLASERQFLQDVVHPENRECDGRASEQVLRAIAYLEKAMDALDNANSCLRVELP